uniref:Uncharacterized protein n=1 Tax=Sphaerodactylus townsendi TaxID=933632 RepID=A0ACB8FER1_9SAUR
MYRRRRKSRYAELDFEVSTHTRKRHLDICSCGLLESEIAACREREGVSDGGQQGHKKLFEPLSSGGSDKTNTSELRTGSLYTSQS